MKIAAYQAPLLSAGSMESLALIAARVRQCEAEGVAILCCPEAVLGGLADNSEDPLRFALSVNDGLASTLGALASDRVTTIVGFTELGSGGRLFNSAAILDRGSVAGVYRKIRPAIRRSVYEPGRDIPVFHAAGLRFGIVICNDSNDPELAKQIVSQGATALFVPTNNGLSPTRASERLVWVSREVDVATAVENRIWVIRADVAGSTDELVSYGSSAIVDPHGVIVMAAKSLSEDLMIVEIGE